MTFENHAGGCGFLQPKWVDVGLLDQFVNSESYHRAQLYLSYSDSKKRHFLHLIDGGPADNLGIRPVIRSLFSTGADPSIQSMVGDSILRHLLIVVVNARTDEHTEIERTPNVPGVISVLSSAASTPFGNYTEESLKRIRDYATAAEATRHEGICVDQLLSRLHPGRRLVVRRYAEVFVAELGLDQIADPHRRATLEAIPTTFQLPDSTVNQLIGAGRDLLRNNADFARAVRAMQFQSTIADTAKVPCQQ
jgi:NTE family protein